MHNRRTHARAHAHRGGFATTRWARLALTIGVAGLAAAVPARAQVVNQLDRGVYRFDADDAARVAALPSISFENPTLRERFMPARTAPKVTPRFAQQGGKSVATIAVDASTSLYGTGMVPGQLMRNGRTTTAWNTDAFGYDDAAPSIYQSHPWVLGVRADGSAFGVLADTTYRCTIDLTSGIRFEADGRAFPIITIEGATPQDVVMKLSDLTGRITMPPKWAIGYHQCRYSYNPDSRALEVAKGFRERKIPCDVIWHDIDYMDSYFCFTFSPTEFPDPVRHNSDLHALGFHTVWMIDPGIGADESKFPAGGYPVYDQLVAGNHAVLDSKGVVYKGEVWPGWCVYPDFLRRETRAWWSGLYADFMATGIDGVWNDMNEPAVFNVASKTMPEDNIHRADAELGGEGPHARYHNVYGMHMVKATREGVMRVNPDKRPFVLSRANFIGGHRYAACWTGDNTANWYHLEASIPMTLNLGLSGQPFTGPDIGGFAGNGDGDMFARWMGFGALFPFARGHTAKGNIDKEPWSFGPEVEATCRAAIEQRYMLLPYYYTLFHDASVTGLPVARPTFFADPTDPALRSEDDSFLIGSDLLVVAHVTPEADRAAVMPKGDWQRVHYVDASIPDLPELYLRDGAIVPSGPVVQYVGEKPLDPLTLTINLDDKGEAVGRLYEDAGDGWSYLDGDFVLTEYRAKRDGNTIRVSSFRVDGDRARTPRALTVHVLTDNGMLVAQGKDGQDLNIDIRSAKRVDR
ncbi:MAG: glycoside hydrolase family 31 protein [Phycisphaerales bacterium]|jgi:alpha-glucosidase|nr:glycoside hydrolase family 31 protein [Phycisphaerales bacterium]